MEKELFVTIYSNSKIYGISQIECMFRCLENFAEERIYAELSVIFKRNKDITGITYEIIAKTKRYIRKKRPFSFILYPKLTGYALPKSLEKYSNVIFK